MELYDTEPRCIKHQITDVALEHIYTLELGSLFRVTNPQG